MRKRKITERQKEIYDFIENFINRNSYPPTMREIAEGCNIKWITAVKDHLLALEQKKYIERIPGISRGIQLIGDNNTAVLASQRTKLVPLIGRISAGSPLLAEEYIIGHLPIPENILGNQESFALQVDGDSMLNAGIHHGDYVIAKCQSSVENGDIIVALIGNDATVKYFYLEENKIRLEPANPAYSSIIYEPNEIIIQGKVVAIYRFFNK